MDSGGYEASIDVDLSDPGKKLHRPRRWTLDRHKAVLRKWSYNPATVVISFDSPTARTDIAGQITRARRLFAEFPRGSSEILFKTENSRQRFLNIDVIIEHVHELANFDIVGLTEKDLGESTLDRMFRIAKLRKALGAAGLETPIHVFGSLDAISTPLYFFAGADIFDGLTWLRYAFQDGETVYKHNYGATVLGIELEDFRVNAKVWGDNYYYLLHLKQDMCKYLLKQDFSHFRHPKNVEFFPKACAQLEEKLKE
jgi:hypothetical protein